MITIKLTDEEVSHLEEVLHGDVDAYYNEVYPVVDDEFKEWKRLTNSILKKCNISEWEEFEIEDD